MTSICLFMQSGLNYLYLFLFASVQWDLRAMSTTVMSSLLWPLILKCFPTGSLIFFLVLMVERWFDKSYVKRNHMYVALIKLYDIICIHSKYFRKTLISNRMTKDLNHLKKNNVNPLWRTHQIKQENLQESMSFDLQVLRKFGRFILNFICNFLCILIIIRI